MDTHSKEFRAALRELLKEAYDMVEADNVPEHLKPYQVLGFIKGTAGYESDTDTIERSDNTEIKL